MDADEVDPVRGGADEIEIDGVGVGVGAGRRWDDLSSSSCCSLSLAMVPLALTRLPSRFSSSPR